MPNLANEGFIMLPATESAAGDDMDQTPHAAAAPKPKKASAKPKARKAPRVAKAEQPRSQTTKKETILGMLRKKDGVTIEELMAATGWLKHSVHGQLANLKRKDGIAVRSTRTSGQPTVYSLAE